ncbi:MAG: addiction module protein [Deltaproteobacteria bacterium]|nr:addiction module protein [Deltaproteobacteria bacterium]
MNNVDHVLAAAQQMPATERAVVVAELLDSLDDLGPADEGVEQAWSRGSPAALGRGRRRTVTPDPLGRGPTPHPCCGEGVETP